MNIKCITQSRYSPCSLCYLSYRLLPCCCCLARYLALAESMLQSLLIVVAAAVVVVVVLDVAICDASIKLLPLLLLSLQAFRLLPTLSANPSPISDSATDAFSANDDGCCDCDSGCDCDCDSGCISDSGCVVVCGCISLKRPLRQ